jgi:hypothetical protein
VGKIKVETRGVCWDKYVCGKRPSYEITSIMVSYVAWGKSSSNYKHVSSSIKFIEIKSDFFLQKVKDEE